MSRRCASSSFGTCEPKRQELSLNIIVDDLDDLPNEPLLSLEDLPDKVSSNEEVSSDKEFYLSFKYHYLIRKVIQGVGLFLCASKWKLELNWKLKYDPLTILLPSDVWIRNIK